MLVFLRWIVPCSYSFRMYSAVAAACKHIIGKGIAEINSQFRWAVRKVYIKEEKCSSQKMECKGKYKTAGNKKVEETIESICDLIQEELKKEMLPEFSEITGLIKALADLVTALANLEMSVRLSQGGKRNADVSLDGRRGK